MHDLTGLKWPRPIDTGAELLEYLSNINEHFSDELTGAELGDVRDYIAQLKIDARGGAAERDIHAVLEWWEHEEAKSKHRQSFHSTGAAARRRQGNETRQKVLRKYDSLTLPERDRAAHIATILDLSPQYVRRILKTAGTNEKRTKLF
jgi:hypothetical protein